MAQRNDSFDVKNLVEAIVLPLVENPQEVAVSERRKGSTVTVKLHVSQNDMGKVIGKQGRIAKSIRTVLKAYAAKEDMFVELDIE
ncbi:MAG: KH domain-containing protein [Eubacteriaceae bacterium]|jgi:predicted RNA-binding protein YlqC (UPF0109 family)|nr:KH domain-containing protein [Eubacteriaceae bacterium]